MSSRHGIDCFLFSSLVSYHTMTTILLLTESSIKTQAVKEFSPDATITNMNCSKLGLPESPWSFDKNGGFQLTLERMTLAQDVRDDYDMVISIENFVYHAAGYYDLSDICAVSIYAKGITVHATSSSIMPPEAARKELSDSLTIEYNAYIQGSAKGIGQILHSRDPTIDPKNWMKTTNNIDRVDQIKEALLDAVSNLRYNRGNKGDLLAAYVSYPDYPKPGVLFQDIFPLFEKPDLLRQMIRFIAQQYDYHHITHIVGLESRGFCLGTALAYKMKVGFIPVRKLNKLPGKCVQVSYEKEYGKDTCEMQVPLTTAATVAPMLGPTVMPFRRVLIIDDLIATGGSMKAAIDLVEKVGYEIVDCCVLREVTPLREICKKTVGRSYTVLLQ